MCKSAPLFCALLLSLSARRAWIEIQVPTWFGIPRMVALRKESVDRNVSITTSDVFGMTSLSARRAWIEIGFRAATPVSAPSLSARRAWIEIQTMLPSWTRYAVALRKESVDRNGHGVFVAILGLVALRKESVDRNARSIFAILTP